MKLYLDTCIWLNVFNKKEQLDEIKESKQLIEKALFNPKLNIYYSGFILKELQFKLNTNNFENKKQFFKKEKLIFIKVLSEDYNLAREFEIENDFELSFFDYMHTSICKQNKLILITRDKDLLKFSKTKINSFSPKELFKRIDFI
ncbi:MAG: PIN domain-containing protein [Candidatus ainarchaeum sp.]|nr:PIN domain-containing protein [Candidatus ainarchaeum sp.]